MSDGVNIFLEKNEKRTIYIVKIIRTLAILVKLSHVLFLYRNYLITHSLYAGYITDMIRMYDIYKTNPIEEETNHIDEKTNHIDEKTNHIDEKTNHIDEKSFDRLYSSCSQKYRMCFFYIALFVLYKVYAFKCCYSITIL